MASRSRPRLVAFALSLVSALGVARAARADDASELEFARTRVSSGLYDEAVKRLSTMLDPALPSCEKGPTGACKLTDPDAIEQARSLLVVSLVALGRDADADVEIEKILRNNPSFVAAPPLFPVKVADRFTTVKVRIKPDLDAIAAKKAAAERLKQDYEQKHRAWLADVVAQASEERIVEKNSRLIALIPFGVGHFQNGRPVVGGTFAAVEAVSVAGTFVTAGVVYASIAAFNNFQASATSQQADKDAFNARVNTAATVNRIFFALWATVTLADITSAQATFVAEQYGSRKRTVKPEPKPPPAIAPTVGYVPGGATAGLAGAF